MEDDPALYNRPSPGAGAHSALGPLTKTRFLQNKFGAGLLKFNDKIAKG